VTDLILAGVATFASLALLTGLAVSYGFAQSSATRRRLAGLAGNSRVAGLINDGPGLTHSSEMALKSVKTFIPKSPKEMGRVQRRLAAAGYHGTQPLTVYFGAEIVLAVVLGVGVLGAFGTGFTGLFLALAAALVGYLVPSFYVQHKTTLRQKEIQNGLPDALDLLIVCLEAGLGIDQAILKCGEELLVPYPALGEELKLLNIETRAGKPRIEAFRNFARRTGVEDVRSLVAMLIQTDRFGTSVAQALRTFAEVSRTKRRQRAEEKAAKLGVKLVFPLVFCLFPAFFVVALGGAVIRLVHLFGSGAASGPMIGGY
jgi:tight adherence protein C